MSTRLLRGPTVSSTVPEPVQAAHVGDAVGRPHIELPVALFDHVCSGVAWFLVVALGALLFAPGFAEQFDSAVIFNPAEAIGSLGNISTDSWSWALGSAGATLAAIWGGESAKSFGWRKALTLVILALLLIATPEPIQSRLEPTLLGLWIGCCLVLTIFLPPAARRLRARLVDSGSLRLPSFAVLRVGPIAEEGQPCVPHIDGDFAIVETLQATVGAPDLSTAAVERLEWLADRGAIDGVLVLVPFGTDDAFGKLIDRISEYPVDIFVQPLTTTVARILPALYSRPIPLHRQPHRGVPGMAKAGLERALAALALLALAPLLLMVAVAIKLDSPGPVFFRQPRFGYGHRPFLMLKFRTMFEGVGDRLGAVQTSRNDSRVTRIGRWLRRTSIDELPQLFNVLIGDMALVGPRAHPVGMCIDGQPYERVVKHYAARHRVKPGITGLAQISGNRGAVQDLDKAKSRFNLDLRYVQSWSLALDVKIIFDTILHLFKRDEAY